MYHNNSSENWVRLKKSHMKKYMFSIIFSKKLFLKAIGYNSIYTSQNLKINTYLNIFIIFPLDIKIERVSKIKREWEKEK